ncbi:MAG: YfhO family protein, partial [Chloroflexota bacterium]
ESLRSGGLDFATATSSSFPPTHLINLVLPNILGTDIDQNYWGYFLGYISQIESGIYVGILPLILALGTVRDFKRSQVLALLVVAVCALVLALGRFTPAFRIVYALPGISSFRIPARMLILFCFALSILAGLGTSRVQSKCQDRSWLRRLALAFSGLGIFFLLLGLIARLGNPGLTALAEALARAVYASAAGGRTRSVDYALGIVQQVMPTLPNQFVFPAIILLLAGGVLVAFRRTPRFALTLLGIIIAFDLAWFSWRYLVVVPVSEIIRPGQKKMLAYLDASPERARIYAEDTLLPTNMGNVFGFANVQSGFPQVSKRYRDLINCGLESSDAVLDLGFFKQFNARALQLLNAATAFTLKPVESSDWKTVAQENVQIIAYDHARSDYPVPQRVMAYVSKSINALPRAFVVYDAQVIADDAATLQTIYRSDFDPARQVVLDQPVGALGPVPASPALAQMQKYAPNQFALLATTDTPGILVLSEIFAPGWSATVDGKSVPVLRANYTLRAVYLSAGTHRVEFDYVPPGLATGLGITIGTGLGVVVVGAALIRRRSAREQGAKR